jgi:DTW domain-containing protein YfiP
MHHDNSMRRLRCDRCCRPVSLCLCAHVAPVQSRTHVLVLQHPEEAKHALNTARLAVLGLPNSELWGGEYFPDLPGRIRQASKVLLLFPGEGSTEPMPSSECDAGGTSLLIVPDGTWRKARKILHLNPVLQALPRLTLHEGEPSRYRIRKAPNAAAVSTAEAITRALSALEPGQDFTPLLQPFDALVEQQIRAMGPDTYAKHHRRNA